MRQPLSIQRWGRRSLWGERSVAPAVAPTTAPSTIEVASQDGRFLAALHPLHRQFLTYRGGGVDGQPHALEDTATHFGLDLRTARLTERYLLARYRLHVDQRGWRASQASTW